MCVCVCLENATSYGKKQLHVHEQTHGTWTLILALEHYLDKEDSLFSNGVRTTVAFQREAVSEARLTSRVRRTYGQN